MDKAIFLDRDGVINKLIFNIERNEFEPPFNEEDLKLYDGVIDSLRSFIENNFKLFLVSNQPDVAKGKTTLENLQNVHGKLHELFTNERILFTDYYYCYHHPFGIVKEYTIDCECRKPKPYFVLKAIKEFNLDKKNSWFVGDRDTDIQCGFASGVKTILISNPDSENYTGNSIPDYKAKNLIEAASIILNKN